MSELVFPECPDYAAGEHCYNCNLILCARKRCNRKKYCSRGCSKEHIPPQAFFAQNKKFLTVRQNPPVQEITVPSCFPCNANASESDEYFVRYIVLVALDRSLYAQVLFKKNKSAWLKNKKMLRGFQQSRLRKYDLCTPENIIVGEKHAVTLPSAHQEQFYKCMDKIVKGLYYKHMGKCLTAPVSLVWATGMYETRVHSLIVPPLPQKTIEVLKNAFASEDIEREEDGILLKIKTRSLQNNLFRYAFMYTNTADHKEILFVFLSFFDAAQFIYVLDENLTNG